MKKNRLVFTKMVATGNDFIVVDNGFQSKSAKLKNISNLAKELCDRRFGIGADGLLILERSSKADLKMRIFNADGTEAEMCGNGLRCIALYACKKTKKQGNILTVETLAGLYKAEVSKEGNVKIKMNDPEDKKMGIPVKLNGRSIRVSYVNTGVPHVIVFVNGLSKIDVDAIGRSIRYHSEFRPKGANVNFVEVIGPEHISVRTYERGVEGETLACGTGATASSVIFGSSIDNKNQKINVHTKGGILKVYFKKQGPVIKDVFLEGEAKIVFEGEVQNV